jgi:hypothetical protein
MNLNHKIVPNKLAKSHVGPKLRERVSRLDSSGDFSRMNLRLR